MEAWRAAIVLRQIASGRATAAAMTNPRFRMVVLPDSQVVVGPVQAVLSHSQAVVNQSQSIAVYSLSPKDLHHLVPKVVDDLDGDAAGFGLGEGAGGVAV